MRTKMTMRAFIFSLALLAGCQPALAEPGQDVLAAPVLRPSITVSSDVVRIGDLIEGGGTAAQIAVYRAPDLGTTGSLHVSQIVETLRTHQVIGVDTRGINEVSVTRASRALSAKDIELQIGKALEQRKSVGGAAHLALTFDRDIGDIQLDASNSGDLRASVVQYNPRNARFDVTFEIANESTSMPTRLRFTGTAVETLEAAVLTRGLERNEILKASDIIIERRPKAEVGNDVASRKLAIGMQLRRALRAGQALKSSDLAKPDLVARDQGITLIYEAPGLYLTGRGKALEAGTEGDTVNVINLQSKRTVQGVVTGFGQVSVMVATPRMRAVLAANTAISSTDHSAKAE